MISWIKAQLFMGFYLFPLLVARPAEEGSEFVDGVIRRVKREEMRKFSQFSSIPTMTRFNFSEMGGTDMGLTPPPLGWNPLKDLKKASHSSATSVSHAQNIGSNLSIADSLAVVVDINGPLGGMSTEYHGSQNFGQGASSSASAKGGNQGRNNSGPAVALVATNANIEIDPNSQSNALVINRANVNMGGNALANSQAQGSVSERSTTAILVILPVTVAPVQRPSIILPPAPVANMISRRTSATTAATTSTTSTTTSATTTDSTSITATAGLDDTSSEEDQTREQKRRARRPHRRPQLATSSTEESFFFDASPTLPPLQSSDASPDDNAQSTGIFQPQQPFS